MGGNVDRLGRLLADARKRQGLTLRAVEDVVGISNAYLSQLENGKVRAPSPVVLHKLSELYRLSYSIMMQEAGYPVPKKVEQSAVGGRFAARVGHVTEQEEDALIEYLMFLRSRKTDGA